MWGNVKSLTYFWAFIKKLCRSSQVITDVKWMQKAD